MPIIPLESPHTSLRIKQTVFKIVASVWVVAGLVGHEAKANPNPSTVGGRLRIKDARQLAWDLNQILSGSSLSPLYGAGDRTAGPADGGFDALLGGLPQHGNEAELAPSLDSIVKLVANACESYASLVEFFFMVSFQNAQVAKLFPSGFYEQVVARSRDQRPFSSGEVRQIGLQSAHLMQRLFYNRPASAEDASFVINGLDLDKPKTTIFREAVLLACVRAGTSFEFITYPSKGSP